MACQSFSCSCFFVAHWVEPQRYTVVVLSVSRFVYVFHADFSVMVKNQAPKSAKYIYYDIILNLCLQFLKASLSGYCVICSPSQVRLHYLVIA